VAHLGAQLLVRTSRKLILTEAGEAFVAVARRLLDDLGDAERAANIAPRAANCSSPRRSCSASSMSRRSSMPFWTPIPR
jgi:DNA-binding transcriptional LysR family regulator